MPMTSRLRVPSRFHTWIEGSDAAIALDHKGGTDDPTHDPKDYDPDRLSAYRRIFETPARKDGSRHVADLTVEELDVLTWDAEYFETLSLDNTWDADGRAELNAARAMLRALANVQPAASTIG
ncbi:hypothetical protein [Amycolatopsis sp. lyj-23]|uniref:hypothetical protein n=1 Tax=Amycolatopsis sp. lyj-23 TaxID=2789283 RepID=UPI00397E20AF